MENRIIYRALPYEDLLNRVSNMMGESDKETACEMFYNSLHEMTELAEHFGLQGNLWHCAITLNLATAENSFSIACEMKGEPEGSITELAKCDFEIFKKMMDYDFKAFAEKMEIPTHLVDLMLYYKNGSFENSKVFNRRIRDRICELAIKLELAKDVDTFCHETAAFYKSAGVGSFGLHKAFRIVHEENKRATLIPITCTEHVSFSDLAGYEEQKKKLIENTEAFLAGRPANNCLLFGDAGTGKSSSVKALLNTYYEQGLRMVEVYKHEFRDLSDIINQVKDRNYRFILFMDDLSFEEFEIEYKYLKAVIEGGLEKKPDNVLIYATSNRRHLIREKWTDKEELDNDIHKNDTVQEKISLANRFGVSIYYGKPNPEQFKQIVKKLAQDYKIDMPEEQLLSEATRWELSHGGISGRCAKQFIMHLLGTEIE